MSDRPISDAWFSRIKAATRDLIRACGGIERAAGLACVSKTVAGRWNSPTDSDVIGVTAILALEAECGLPIVTTVMADLGGRRLAEPGDEQSIADTVFSRHADAMHRFAEVMSTGAKAAADGKLTAAEAELMCRAYGELQLVVADIRQNLARAKGPRAVSS